MLDYKLLEALACVVREQGFDKAAKKMCITQSAVSQRIKALEEQAGQILVTRTVPPKPTPEGSRLLKHYLQVVTLEADLAESEGSRGADMAAIAIGINADSLATWFLDAVDPFLKTHRVLMDIKIDDQDETHKMLRNGEVSGCVSSESRPVQGCRSVHIGSMNYRLAATPDFLENYRIRPLTEESLTQAPAVIFNRKDDLHHQFYRQFFKKEMPGLPVTYIPSSESFAKAITCGIAYGMIPDLQGKQYIDAGLLIDLAPECHITVNLYWHCWNIRSRLLEELTAAIVNHSMIC